jgi:hypothetical protein
LPDGQSDELKPTQDGLGWVCGEDIDVTRIEEPCRGVGKINSR